MADPHREPHLVFAERAKEARQKRGDYRFATLLFGSLSYLGAVLLLARRGEVWAQVVAWFLFLAGMVALVSLSVRAERRSRRGDAWLRAIVAPIPREWSGPVERAFRLYQATEAEPTTGSLSLSRRFLLTRLGELPDATLHRYYRRERRIKKWLMLSLLAGSSALILLRGFFLLEGMSLLFARGSEGAFALPYVASFEAFYELPAYLRTKSGPQPLLVGQAIPAGSKLKLRVVPREPGRELVLLADREVIPFRDEGDGALVVEKRLGASLDFRVAATCGKFVIPDLARFHLETTEDTAPQVHLLGAPRTVKVAEMQRLELEVTAKDDHGLENVDLILESGRERRSVEMVRYHGQARTYQGAHALLASDPFIARAYLPVRIWVEATDGDTETGPHTGVSEAITLIPEPIASLSARKYSALKEFRAPLVKALADLLALHRAPSREEREELLRGLTDAKADVEARITQLSEPPQQSLRFLSAQLETIRKRGPSEQVFEETLLAVDVLLKQFSYLEATKGAKELGRAVAETAVFVRQRFLSGEGEPDETLLMDRLTLLEASSDELAQLGELGRDLGSVARGDLGRARRMRLEKSFGRLELVLLHLAERLTRATPSFGAKGAASESGHAEGGGGESESGEGEHSSAPSESRGMERSMEQLKAEHARELSELERSLEAARESARADAGQKADLDDEAQRLRDAMEALPDQFGLPGSARSAAAAGRSEGESAAASMEAGDLKRAEHRAIQSQEALRRARELGKTSGSLLREEDITHALSALSRALSKIREKKSEQRARASELDKERLSERAKNERRILERATALSEEAAKTGGTLPEAAQKALSRARDHMRRAAELLERGSGQEAREQAELAQRALEEAQPSESADRGQSPSEGNQSSGDAPHAGSGEVPKAESKDRTLEFRRRVQAGLSRDGGHLSPFVRKYAEALE